jgi:Fe-S cluster assembly iron-binding protein IscA
MLDVSQRAVKALHATLEENSDDEASVLRLDLDDEQVTLSLHIDEVRDGDQVVEDAGRPVLVIERGLAEQMDGASIDVVDTEDGEALVFNPPGPPNVSGADI